MSKSQKRTKSPQQIEMDRYVRDAQDQLDEDMQRLVAQHGDVVTLWLMNEVSSGKWTFEEAAHNLARNFVLAHTTMGLMHLGKQIEKEMDDHTTSGLS